MRNNIVFLIINLIGAGFAIDLIVRIANGYVGFGFQWLGIIIVVLYSLWIRYYIRENILNKIKFFKYGGISRPYVSAAMLFLFIAMIFDLAGNERVANGFAIIVYYFLIEVVIVEIINLRKKGSTEKKENA
ncbi:MAG: hypothetical protein ACYCS0_03270 [bacterium]